MKLIALLGCLVVIATPATAQQRFDLRFDHTTILVTDLQRSGTFYEHVLLLETIETPWGPSAPIRFFSLGGTRQLHVGIAAGAIEPDRNAHLALSVSDFDGYLRFLRDNAVNYSDFQGRSGIPQVRPDGVRQVYLQDPDGNWIEINDAGHP